MKTRYRHPALSIIPVLLMGIILACGFGLTQSQEQVTAVDTPINRNDTGADPTSTIEIETESPQTVFPYPTTVPTEAFDKWALWINGPHLRGANIHQRRVYPELDGPEFMGSGYVGPPYTQEDFNRLAALGANYVNISHPGLFTEDPPYSLDQNMQNNLDNLINMIAQADMFAVISFRTGPGRSEFTFFYGEDDDWFDNSYYNDAVWQDQSAQDAWAAMWKYTAQRYKDNPIVAGLDLMVEPNANEVWLDEWDPDIFYDDYANTLYDWNQFFPRITVAIRQVDAGTPILVGGMAYSNIDWLPYLRPSDDPRTVYTFHQYAPHHYTHQYWDEIERSYPGTFDTDWDGEDDQFDRNWLDGLFAFVGTFVSTHGVPTAVNEFGIVRWVPGAAEFIDDQIDLFEQRGLNHALWVWDPAWQPFTEENNAFNFRFGPDPQNISDVDNELINVIVKYWQRNNIRPSSTLDSTSFLPIVTGAGDREDGAFRLTTPSLGVSDQNPAFSPNGSHLVFTRFENGYNQGPAALFLLDLNGKQNTRLTPWEDQDNVNLPGAAWNAAEDRIVFASDRLEADDIWRIAPDGSDFTRITTHNGSPWYIEPSWSPDGQWIVFEADDDVPDDRQQGSIWKVRADGTDLTVLTDGPSGGTDDRQPNWSPAGDRILFQRRVPGSEDWNLYTMAPDGSDIQTATTAPSSDTDASWSPDGSWIVYSSDYGGLPVPNIFVILTFGGQPVRVTFTDEFEDGAPSWSPDGKWIAFESHEGQDEDTPSSLWRILVPDDF